MNAALIRHARRLFYGQALVKQTQTTVTPRVRRRNDSPGVPISGTQKFMRSSVIHDVYVPWWQITQSKYFLTATPKTRRASNGKPYVITARDPEEHRGLPRLLAGTFGDSPRVIRKKFGTLASHLGTLGRDRVPFWAVLGAIASHSGQRSAWPRLILGSRGRNSVSFWAV